VHLTLRKAAEDASRDELERLKADLVAKTSHELRTPLAIIREFTALVKDGVAGPVTSEQIE